MLEKVKDLPVGTEAMVNFTVDGKSTGYFVGGQTKMTVKPQDLNVPYYSLHNHPSNGILSPEDIQQLIKRPLMKGIGAVGNAGWRADLTRGWPYTEDDPEPDFFDWTPDPDRSATTDSIYLLKATGNWTEEDERVAFDPSKPPPRPLAELEAEHDAFMKELLKNAKPL